MFFDSHAHYDDPRFDPDREALLAALPSRGVSFLLNAGTDLATSRFGIDLAARYDFIYAAVGLHPHEAKALDENSLPALEAMSRENKVVALGEIGLDYHYDFSPRAQQRRAFREQMALAEALDLPVIVHDREAHEDCLEIVREFPRVRGVFHCYSGSWEMARILLDAGWYLSFNGAITFKNARRALEVVSQMPLERLMLETDCPYLTPEPYRGRRNDSGYISLVGEKVAQLRDLPLETIARLTLENALTFFGIRA